MSFVLCWLIGSLVTLAGLAIWFFFDRKQATPTYDESCSKIDDELTGQGK